MTDSKVEVSLEVVNLLLSRCSDAGMEIESFEGVCDEILAIF